MDGYSGIHFGQQGYTGNVSVTGNTSSNSSQGVDVTQLQAGDTFKGEIASVNGEDVQILLTNGQYMSARLERDVQIALGQVLNLQVQSNKDNKIVLKPLYDNNAQMMRVGEAALRAANIAVNSRNLNLVSNLLQNGMSIDKNTLMTYNRLALQNPQADISEIIELNKLKVPVNEGNLNQLQNYENMQHKLIDGVNETADEVLKLYEGISQENGQGTGGVAVAGKFMEQVVELLSEDDNKTLSVADKNIALENAEPNIELDGKTKNQADVNLNTEQKPDTANGTANDTIKSTDNNTSTTTDIKNITTENKDNAVNSNTNVAQNDGADRNVTSAMKELSKGSVSEIPEKIIKYISDGKLDIKDVKQLLNDSNVGEKLSTEQKAEIFKSEPFKAMVKSEFQNRWTLTPNDIATEGKVEEFYEKLAKETAKLTKMINEAINESGQDASTVQAKAASNMSENIEFMNQVNHMMNYVQLPLKFNDSQAHGDLYVYTNKKNLARKDGMLTAFLHLDMDNLGSLDVSIALQTDKNQVTTKFYLDEDVIPLVEEHKEELIKRLSKKGYQCNAMLLEKDEDKTVLERIEEQVSGQSAVIGYQTFDTRA
jgi:hypothetical protein